MRERLTQALADFRAKRFGRNDFDMGTMPEYVHNQFVIVAVRYLQLVTPID